MSKNLPGIILVQAAAISFLIVGCTAEYALRLQPASSILPDGSVPAGTPTEPGGGKNAATDPLPAPTTPQLPPLPPVVCDPFAAANIVGPEYGISGQIFAEGDSNIGYNLLSSFDYFTPARLFNVELVLSAIDVPGRRWQNGFSTPQGNQLKVIVNGVETPFIEWFAIQGTSKIVLADGDLPGKKQFALISDDGSTLEIQDSAGVYQTMISNEGLHSQKLKVSESVLDFQNATSQFPMRINYFQGPRVHIALQLLWRNVESDSAAHLAEPLNGAVGGEYFWDTRVTPVVQTPAYQDFLSRGWRPLRPQNFMRQSGYNRCTQTTMGQ